MKLLNKLTNYLIHSFNISINENSYRVLMLLISLIISVIYFTGFGITSYLNNSLILMSVFGFAAFISVINLVLLKLKSTGKLSAYLFILTLNSTMFYLVFDSGRNGYGYIWFYILPILNIAILGVKKGTIISVMFVLSLTYAFSLPDYQISIDYFPELKPRLIASLIAIIVLLFFREWAIELFKQEKQKEDIINQKRLNYSKDANVKLSNQVRNASNKIIDQVNYLKKQDYNRALTDPFNNIKDLSSNVISILDNINDISNVNSVSFNDKVSYNLQSSIESVTNLFKSYDVSFEIIIDKNLPVNFYSKEIEIKQMIYQVIENLINQPNENKIIKIYVTKGDQTNNFYEIKYQIVTNLYGKLNIETYENGCRNDDLFTEEDYSLEKINDMGLHALEPILNVLNGGVYIFENINALSICLNQKIMQTDAEFKKMLSVFANSTLNKTYSKEVVYKKLGEMRVLVMEDNLMSQKTMVFVLNKMVKKIDIAQNGKEGLALFNMRKYDLILLDLRMPIINGFDVAEKIRKIELGTKYRIPIIAVSSTNSKDRVETTLDLGFDAYIEKPFKANDLFHVMNKILNAN